MCEVTVRSSSWNTLVKGPIPTINQEHNDGGKNSKKYFNAKRLHSFTKIVFPHETQHLLAKKLKLQFSLHHNISKTSFMFTHKMQSILGNIRILQETQTFSKQMQSLTRKQTMQKKKKKNVWQEHAKFQREVKPKAMIYNLAFHILSIIKSPYRDSIVSSQYFISLILSHYLLGRSLRKKWPLLYV